MTERWLPVPGCSGYEVSDRGRVRGVHRVVIRSNGSAYTCQPKILRHRRHRTTDLVTVCLAQGRRGRCRYLYVHRLVADVFGDQANAA